jgi:DNA repair protein SbcD/Mre11
VLRLVHTSDWHLGRRLGEADRLEDQAYALDQIFALCRDARAHALVVAGDVYDRAVPPVEAVELLDGFLRRCARDLKIRVLLLAGNHDSPQRLGFGAELLADAGITLATRPAQRLEPVVVEGVPIFALPYLEPEVARAELADDTLRNHDAAVRAALVDMHARRAPGPAVLVGHMFAAGGRETADSERPLSVGSAGQVGGDALDGWSYVALGHLHAPQQVGGREHVRYSGSLLKYSFSEHEHDKGVELVEVGERVQVERVVLTPRRDVVRIEGGFDELLADERFASAESAWVEATYTDTGYVLEAAQRLRARFPFLLAARPKQLLRVASGDVLVRAQNRGDRELLAGFWAHVGAGGELEPAHIEAYERVLHAARSGDVAPGLEIVP